MDHHPFALIVSTGSAKLHRCRECGRLRLAHLTRAEERIAAYFLRRIDRAARNG